MWTRVDTDTILFDSRTSGSRIASRVRVASPRGSVFDGRRGIVSRQSPLGDWGGTVLVRMDKPFVGVELPFDRTELEVLS